MPTLLYKRLSTTARVSQTEWAIGDIHQPLAQAKGTGVVANKITYDALGNPRTIVDRYPNGKIAFIVHKDVNELFHGICKRFTPEGKLLQVCIYRHGKAINGRALPANFSFGYAWKKSNLVAQQMGLV
ncbi:MAG: hypothetical protein RBJ76_13125 [Stenomitos frigidus ULC029]